MGFSNRAVAVFVILLAVLTVGAFQHLAFTASVVGADGDDGDAAFPRGRDHATATQAAAGFTPAAPSDSSGPARGPGEDASPESSSTAAPPPGVHTFIPASQTATVESVLALRQCAPLGRHFAEGVASWIDHAYPSANRAQTADESDAKAISRLIYWCESSRAGRLCGGMGDRFRGLVSVAWIALLARRRLELFHPAPCALQEFLAPRLVAWTPTLRCGKRCFRPASNASQLAEVSETIPISSRLMSRSGYKKFAAEMAGEIGGDAAASTGSGSDRRLQSNALGVESYLLRHASFRRRYEELGIPPSCNISCYYGCMHALLFQPTAALKTELRQRTILGRTPMLPPLSPSSNGKQTIADAVIAAHEQRGPLVPMVGVQVRVGGEWAGGLRVAEPYRTHPRFLPLMLQDIAAGAHAGARAGAGESDAAVSSGVGNKPLAVFVTSDSWRFVNVSTLRLTAAGLQVLSLEGDAYQHTDTLNVHDARPDKYKRIQSDAAIRTLYLLTLLNHFVLSACATFVIGQSGFADTAFFAARPSITVRSASDLFASSPAGKEDEALSGQIDLASASTLAPVGAGATCMFVDMSGYRTAWQHQQVFLDAPGRPSAAIAVRNRIVGADALQRRGAATLPPFYGPLPEPANSRLDISQLE